MRSLALLLLLGAGCPNGGGGPCDVDSQCSGGEVCTRIHECLPPSQVRSIRVTWTVGGMPANDQRCASFPDLEVTFHAYGRYEDHGYAPVPCKAGLFTIDKLPRDYNQVTIQAGSRFLDAPVTSAGTAAFDL